MSSSELLEPKTSEFSVTPSVQEAMLRAAKDFVGATVEVLPTDSTADAHDDDERTVRYTVLEGDNASATNMDYATRLAATLLGNRPQALGLDPHDLKDPRDMLDVAAANAGYLAASIDDPTKVTALKELDSEATKASEVVGELLAGRPKLGSLAEKRERLASLNLQPGDIIERDGQKYMAVLELFNDPQDAGIRPFTYKEYYSHTFPVGTRGRRLIGPGWDNKYRLIDPEVTLRDHDRKFTDEELKNLPSNLPEEDMLVIAPLGGDKVKEYEDYRQHLEQARS